MFLIMVGCGGKNGRGGGGGGPKDAEIKQAITVRLNSFKTAVEAYDVEGMLDFLAKNTDTDKVLTIAEEGIG